MKNLSICLLIITILQVGCATTDSALERYEDSFIKKVTGSFKNPTHLVILIDGLSLGLIKTSVERGLVPHIQHAFLGKHQELHIAHSVFPSVTYANLAALLTRRPVSKSGIYGNRIRHSGETLNFENPLYMSRFGEMLDPHSIFHQFKAQNRPTASISFSMRTKAATAGMPHDLVSGLAYANENFIYVDEKLTESLLNLLQNTEMKKWPEFIFLHIAGVDGVVHKKGPHSYEVDKILNRVDALLKPLFDLMSKAERDGKPITMLLTSDHGYVNVSHLDLIHEELIQAYGDIHFLNEGRMGSVFLPNSMSQEEKMKLRAQFLKKKSVESIVERVDNTVTFHMKNSIIRVEFQPMDTADLSCGKFSYRLRLVDIVDATKNQFMCPEEWDRNLFHYDSMKDPFYKAPFFFTAISDIFFTPNAPTWVILPKPNTSFKNDGLIGQHGGSTPEEMITPLLLRNLKLKNKNEIVPIYNLLDYVH